MQCFLKSKISQNGSPMTGKFKNFRIKIHERLLDEVHGLGVDRLKVACRQWERKYICISSSWDRFHMAATMALKMRPKESAEEWANCSRSVLEVVLHWPCFYFFNFGY